MVPHRRYTPNCRRSGPCRRRHLGPIAEVTTYLYRADAREIFRDPEPDPRDGHSDDWSDASFPLSRAWRKERRALRAVE
jgi:hypothetical protein